MQALMIPLKSVLPDELEAQLAAAGEPKYRARQIVEWVYSKRVCSFDEMKNLPLGLREKLAAQFSLDELKLARRLGANDTTQKFLFELRDQNFIESVLIPASPALYGERSDRRTLCVSTQVGCAYGCKFCASGLDGWTRNLNAGEIVDQLMQVEKISGEPIDNVVFMGMGEPFANFENLMRAIQIINSPWALGLGARHITVSTSGLAPQIRKLAEQPLQIRLAVSLHGATDEVREKIMPVNRKYNLATLLDACAYYQQRKKQRITFEYILIADMNDSPEQAAALAARAGKLNAKINLIPYNNVEGLPWKRPSQRRQLSFLNILREQKIPATIRREKGHDIDAACGQLRLQAQRDKIFAEINKRV